MNNTACTLVVSYKVSHSIKTYSNKKQHVRKIITSQYHNNTPDVILLWNVSQNILSVGPVSAEQGTSLGPDFSGNIYHGVGDQIDTGDHVIAEHWCEGHAHLTHLETMKCLLTYSRHCHLSSNSFFKLTQNIEIQFHETVPIFYNLPIFVVTSPVTW